MVAFLRLAVFSPLFHNVKKWLNILLKNLAVFTPKDFLKYVWPFFNIFLCSSNTEFIQFNHVIIHHNGSSFFLKLDHRRGRGLQKWVCLCLQIPSDPWEEEHKFQRYGWADSNGKNIPSVNNNTANQSDEVKQGTFTSEW